MGDRIKVDKWRRRGKRGKRRGRERESEDGWEIGYRETSGEVQHA